MHQQLGHVTPQDHLGAGTATSDAHDRGVLDQRATASGADARWRRLAPLAVGAATAAATLAVTWWNPSDTGAPTCPSKFLLGVDCPFCGTTRATAALARGQVGRALDHNVMWVALVPVVGAAFALWAISAVRDRPMPTASLPRWVWVTLGVAFVAFGVARNLDVSAFTRWLGADAAVF